MFRSLRVAVYLALLAAVASMGLGQGPAKPAKAGPKEGEPPTKDGKPDQPKKTPLEKMKAPPGSIFVVVEDLQQALGLHPKLFVLTLEKYQEMMDEIALLKSQLKKDRKTPHACKITGKVDGDVATLEVQYVFSTEKANTTVVLGMQGGHLTREGDLDGQLPNMDFGDEGFVVEVENPGRHQLTLRLEAPVLPRKLGLIGGGSERALELGLPGAAVTTVSLELPSAVQELRWNDQVEKRSRGGRWEFAASAKAKSLVVAWKEPMTFPGVGPIRTAEGQINVSIEESQVLVKAELTLETLRGQTNEWQLLLPPDADVEAKNAAGTAIEVSRPDKKGLALIRLAQPSSERVQVSVQFRQPRSTARLPIGPVAVIGADIQKGAILIRATPEAVRGTRVIHHRHGEISQRESPKTLGAGEVVLASFQYWSLQGLGKGPPSKGPRGVPLELEFKTERGQVATRVEHSLRVRSVAEGYRLEATTRIKCSELHGPVDYLELQLPRLPVEPLPGLLAISPSGFPDALPWLPLVGAAQVGSGRVPEPEAQTPTTERKSPYTCRGEGKPQLRPANLLRRAHIRWTEPKGKDFTVELVGSYLLPPGSQRVRLDVPRPIGTRDRGGEVTTTVSDDNLELLIEDRQGDRPGDGEKLRVRAWDGAPAFVDLMWRPYQPEFPAIAEADIELKEGYARVRQQFRFDLPGASDPPGPTKPRDVRFRIPQAVQPSLKVGGRVPKGSETLSIPVSADSATTVLLEYDLPLPPLDGAGRVVALPLVWPEAVTRIDGKVRVWCEAGVVPRLAEPELLGAFWKIEGPEVVPGRSSLPALVLSASGKAPLRLRVKDTLPARKIEMLIDRAFIQAVVDDEGHHYRARFLVRKFNSNQVNLEIPAPVLLRDPVVYLGSAQGERKPLKVSVSLERNVLHIPVNPELFPDPVFLDVEYHLPVAVLESGPFWQMQLYAPVFKGEVFLKRVSWQVHCPSSVTPLIAGRDMRPEFRWGFRGGLVTPEPEACAELEDWPDGPWPALAPPRLVFSSPSLEPVPMLQAPWQAWLLVCSGAVLLAGLALAFSPVPRLVFWMLLILVAAGALAARSFWPALFPMLLYGMQPGVVALLLVLGVNWMVQARYRRQLVFMPGFAPRKPGSSVTRPGAPATRPREASTVDAPAANGSSPSGGSHSAGAPTR